MTTSTREMLRFLTHKLKSSSLNEVQPLPAQAIDDDDRDSGTESDDENNELDDIDDPDDGRRHYNNSPVRNSGASARDGRSNDEFGTGNTKTHEISDHNFDTVSCTSDYERQSLDFDRHSSEDELGSINKENVAEKRKWSQAGCDSSSSSDEEVKELLFNPQPVLLSASPPKGVLKIYTQNASPRQVLARMTPVHLPVSAVSPRKRHRKSTTSDSPSDSEEETGIQRPCLDFEKMQQVRRLCPAYFKRCKISKSIKLQTA